MSPMTTDGTKRYDVPCAGEDLIGNVRGGRYPCSDRRASVVLRINMLSEKTAPQGIGAQSMYITPDALVVTLGVDPFAPTSRATSLDTSPAQHSKRR